MKGPAIHLLLRDRISRRKMLVRTGGVLVTLLFGSTFASASAPSSGLCAVRVLARDATALYRALNACRAQSRAHLGLSPPPREVW